MVKQQALTLRPPLRHVVQADGALLGVGALALACFYVCPWPLLALPCLLVFGWLAWRRLDLALCLLPLTFPYWYVPKPILAGKVFPLSEIALGVCLLIALGEMAVMLLRKRAWPVTQWRVLARRIGWPTLIGAGLLLVGMSLGVLVARRRPEALRAWRWEIVEPLIYLLLVVGYVRGRAAAQWLVWAMLGSALIVAALAIVQVIWLHVTFAPLADGGNHLIPYVTSSGASPRATAIIYGSGNSLGAWLERAFPLALAIALVGLDGGGKGRSGRITRALAAICALIYLPALLWSASRGAEVGTVAGALVVLAGAVALWLAPRWRLTFSHWSQRRMALTGAAAVFVVLAGIVIIALSPLGALLTSALIYGHNGSGEERLLLWLAALHMIRDHPLLGIGPDQFLYYYSNRYTNSPYWITILNGHATVAGREPNLAHPHNLLLDLWLSAGLLGLVGYILVFVALLQRGHVLWRRGPNWVRPLALGVCGTVVAGVVHGMVDSAYFVPDLALAFWWAVALLIVVDCSVSQIAHNL